MAPTSPKLPSGHLGNLSLEQSAVLAEFKEELKKEGAYETEKHSDAMLLRFLRARNFVLAKSKLMWINDQKWRVEFGVDDLYENFQYPEKAEVTKLYPRFCHKVDRDGRPLCIEAFGKIDAPKLFALTTVDRQLKALVVELETILRDRLRICSEVAGRRIDTTCTVIDVKGVPLSLFWSMKDHLQALLAVSQDHYPEVVGKVLIINSPWAFAVIWSFLKGRLAEATVARIAILGTDYKDELLKHIPADSLPKYLGGTCECEGGCAMSDAGPWAGKVRIGLPSYTASPTETKLPEKTEEA
ncbi:hypothetical protein RQP46_000168 [Phenoliferia psychrophenolica]